MMYQGLAAIYDALMADVDYEGWAAYYLHLAREYGIELSRAADCACGTGSLTIPLQKRGLVMTGLDMSADMLRVAGQKARVSGVQIPFVRQDIRNLLLHRPQDAIFCGCDGVNYLVRPADTQAFFTAAYRALRPGGGLFFDVSSPYKLSQTLGNRCLGEDGEVISYIWQNHFDPPSSQLQMDLTFFVRQADGRYTRFAETHFQRAHTARELTAWLSHAGFTNIRVLGDRTFSAPLTEEGRMHVAAMRPCTDQEGLC